MEEKSLTDLQNLKESLANDQIIRFDKMSDERISEMLDNRDREGFDTEWMRVFEDLNNSGESFAPVIEEIRYIALIKTFNMFNHEEFSSYVAEDFELFAKSLQIGYEDDWLNSLFGSYLQGVFPHSDLPPNKNSIARLLKTLR